MKKQAFPRKSAVNLPLVNPNAAGIDVGDTIHAVAVPEGRDPEPVRSFGTMTCDLEAYRRLAAPMWGGHGGHGEHGCVVETPV